MMKEIICSNQVKQIAQSWGWFEEKSVFSKGRNVNTKMHKKNIILNSKRNMNKNKAASFKIDQMEKNTKLC